MNFRDRERFRTLAAMCSQILTQTDRQSINIFRGDMRAIVSAAREVLADQARAPQARARRTLAERSRP